MVANIQKKDGKKDNVTFSKTAAETNGEYTVAEGVLANAGECDLNFLKTYNEKFDCTEGEIQVQLD